MLKLHAVGRSLIGVSVLGPNSVTGCLLFKVKVFRV